jgi:hypothetical protein
MNTAAVCNATKIRATVVVGKASASSAKRVVPTQRAAQRVVKVRLRCVVRCVLRWNGSEGLIESSRLFRRRERWMDGYI